MSIFLLTLSACAVDGQHAETFADSRTRLFAVDTSPPNCHTRDHSRTIDNVVLRFPKELKTWGSTEKTYVELFPGASDTGVFGASEAIRLINRDHYRDATAIMTDIFPQWAAGNFVTVLHGKTLNYERRVDSGYFATSLDLLATKTPMPHDLYFYEAAENRVTTLITCPFNPVAVTPMMWCTLSKSDNAGIGYEVSFQAADLERWRDVEALAKDIMADAMVCGQS